jgi:hypothetical protein
MQVQDVLVGKILLAFRAPVHVRLLVMHVIFVERSKGKWLVGRQQALHDSGLFREGRICIEVHKLEVDRLLTRVGAAGIFCRRQRVSA